MEKSENHWVLFAYTGITLILLAGIYTGVPTWLDYLDYGLLAGGIIFLILAAIDFRKRKKV